MRGQLLPDESMIAVFVVNFISESFYIMSRILITFYAHTIQIISGQ